MAKRLLVTAAQANTYPALKDVYGENIQVKVNITIQPELLTFTMTYCGNVIQGDIDSDRVYREDIAESYTLPLDAVKSAINGSLKSNVLLAPNPPIHESGAGVSELTSKSIVNLSAYTYHQRIFNPYSNKHTRPTDWKYFPLIIFVHNPNGTFDDHDIIMPSNTDGNMNIISNEEFTEYSTHLQLEDFVSQIEISKDTEYSNNDYNRYTVTTDSYVDNVFLESINGIADKSQVTITNGVGSFRVLKNSVDGADKVKIKAGFQYYPRTITYVDE